MNHFSTHHDQNQYIAAQERFAKAFAPYCDYAITLQSTLRTYRVSPSTMIRRTAELESALGAFRLRMNRLLTGHGWRRKDALVPVFIPSIEGTRDTTDINLTLHVHALLGNTGHCPSNQTRVLLEDAFRQIWSAIDVGTEDVYIALIIPDTHDRCMGYQAKEAQHLGHWEVFNWQNAQAPRRIINSVKGTTQAP